MGERRTGRRTFLKALGGLVIAAGTAGAVWQTLGPKEKPPRQVKPNAYTQNGRSLISIAEATPETDIEDLVRRSVNTIGGIERIVSSGKVVVVKPAVLTSDPACAPDPNVVAAVVKLAREAGGRVIVAESSGGGDTTYALSQVGITAAVQNVGGEVKALPSEQGVQIPVPKGVSLQSVWTYPTVNDCDVLISVPRLKRHSSTTVTLSLKNMMGAIPNSEKSRFHSVGLAQCIADLNTALKPDLTVVDATLAMTRTGPTGGDMVRMDTVMASGDPVAVDNTAAGRLHELETRLGIPSFNPPEIRHIQAAATLGVGTNDPSRITILEEKV